MWVKYYIYIIEKDVIGRVEFELGLKKVKEIVREISGFLVEGFLYVEVRVV